jgi:hypothetical protein
MGWVERRRLMMLVRRVLECIVVEIAACVIYCGVRVQTWEMMREVRAKKEDRRPIL